MANRSTLKNYFQAGSLPSANHFGELIDACVNKEEDGFDRSPALGLRLQAAVGETGLLSFARESRPNTILWSASCTRDAEQLHFKSTEPQQDALPVLSLSRTGGVGVRAPAPPTGMRLEGCLHAGARLGVATADKLVPADGAWHDITDDLTGCHALEVVAGVGKKRTGQYALLRATALNAHNPSSWWAWWTRRRKPIRHQHAYYDKGAHRLQLRWHGEGRTYRLQLRSKSGYGEGILIRYYVTRLWLDAFMDDSLPDAKADMPPRGTA